MSGEPNDTRRSVFLSYARDDDQPFVRELHRRLEEAGVAVWWDRDSMENRGRTFLQELRDAIDEVDRVVAVLGPQALRSEYVLVEWRHAQLFGTPIVPVLRAGSFADAPQEIAVMPGVDMTDDAALEESTAALLDLLRQPVAALGPFLTPVPALPTCFQPRAELLERVHEHVLGDTETPEAVGDSDQVLVMHGMGGSGKSVLAAAFCRLVRTRRALPEGIAWVEAGPDAQPLAALRKLALALGAAPNELTDMEETRAALLRRLTGARRLLVLDDVWDVRFLTPFLNALAPQTRLIVTTRSADLLPGRPSVPVEMFDHAASLALLSAWSAEPAIEMPQTAQRVVERCSGLPFALALCGAMRRELDTSWDDIMAALDNADLGHLRGTFPNYEQYTNLLACLQVSIDALEPTDASAFRELVVFCDAELVPEAAVTTLWTRNGEPGYRARALLGDMGAKALVRLEGRAPDRRVVFHALLADYLRAVSGDDEVAALHDTIVDAYAAHCQGRWASGPSDGYFFDNLCRHLSGSGRGDELRSLLGGLEWLRARRIATNAFGLVADFRFLDADDDLRAVEGALRLGISGIAAEPNQIAGHLLGRLEGNESAAVRALCEEVRRFDDGCWLDPCIAPLRQVGDPLLHRFDAHHDPVFAAAMTADGTRAATGDEKGRILVWDLDGGSAIAEMQGPQESVRGLAMLEDGARVVAAFGEYGITFLRVADTRLERHLPLSEEKVTSLACMPDGSLVVAGVERGVVSWDVTGERAVLLTRTAEAATTDVALSPDGQRVVVGVSDGQVELWDLRESRMAWHAAANGQIIRSVGFDSTGDRVFSLGDDYAVRLRDAGSGQELSVGGTHGCYLGALQHPRGDWLFAGDVHGMVQARSLEEPIRTNDVAAHLAAVRAIATGARRVMTTAHDGSVRVWDAERLKSVPPRANQRGTVAGVDVRRDGSMLVSASTEGEVRLWNPTKPGESRVFGKHGCAVRAVALSPTESLAASTDMEGRVALWSSDSLDVRWVRQVHESAVQRRDTEEGKQITLALAGGVFVRFAQDGKTLLAGGADGTFARFDDLESQDAGFRFELGEGGPWHHSAARNGYSVASVADTGAPLCFMANSGKGGELEGGEETFVTAVAQSDDGRFVMCGYANGVLCIWDLTSGKQPITRTPSLSDAEPAGMFDINTGRRSILEGGSDVYYTGFDFSADARYAAMVTNVGLLVLRDLHEGHPVAGFVCDDELFSCAMSADAEWIAAGGRSSFYLFRTRGHVLTQGPGA